MSELPISSAMTGEPHADSIEIELTAADLEPRPALGQPAPGESREAPAARRGTVHPNVPRQAKRIAGAVGSMFVFIALRSVVEYDGLAAIQLPPQPQPPPHVSDNAPAAPPQLAYEQPAELNAPLRMANPFDASEVFEFPPGTSRAEARESIANVLLQRARERRPQSGAAKHRARQQLAGDTSAS